MRLTHLEVTDHRNISHAELHPDPHLTVLCGPNGQGKTNLLEAIWLLTGGKSFRGSKDAELIRRGCDFSVIEGAFETQDVEKSIRLTVGSRQSQRPGRTGKLNGADVGARGGAGGGTFRPSSLSRTCWGWSRAARTGGGVLWIPRFARSTGPTLWRCGGTCG